MKYIPSFDQLKRSILISTVRGELRVSCSYETFLDLLKKLLIAVEVDQEWYLRTYVDIAEGVKKGTAQSAFNHFIYDGFFEGRMPFPMQVDETWYLEQNPDVAEDIRQGHVESAQQHFEVNGYREGRMPWPGAAEGARGEK